MLHRLAVYGTLRPGGPNHHELAGIAGRWSTGVVRGRLHPEGWGAAQGFPALEPDPRGAEVRVDVLSSDELPAHWPRLDAFEGAGYRRVHVQVMCDDGEVRAAQLYALRRDG